MSENTPETPAQESGENQPTATPAEGEAAKSATDWVAEARKWEQRAKDNASAAKKLAELEDANKSEATKAAEKIADLESQLAAASASALRAKTAAESGLPIELLTASDEDGLKEQVKALTKWQGEQKKGGNHAPNAGRTPTPPPADEKQAFANFLTGRSQP